MVGLIVCDKSTVVDIACLLLQSVAPYVGMQRQLKLNCRHFEQSGKVKVHMLSTKRDLTAQKGRLLPAQNKSFGHSKM